MAAGCGAPGSVRGVVDFIHIGRHYYNAADFFIIGCTPLFLLAAGYQGVRAARRPAAAGSTPPPARGRVRARLRIPALVGAGLILVVALGAANYGGVNAAPRKAQPDGARNGVPSCGQTSARAAVQIRRTIPSIRR